MTPEQQRIAIAESCGWKWKAKVKGAIKVWHKPPDMVFYDHQLPDYPNDLNAMHDAEKSCILETFEKSLLFRNALHKICCDGHNYKIEASLIWHATAAQRAEAFLRTLNLWKE